MPDFIPGLELGRLFYLEAVRPILDSEFPQIVHSAALLGSGSEILGFDTAQSSDHHWGPRVMLFVSDEDRVRYAAEITETLRHRLPYTFRGYPTNYGAPDEIGVQLMCAIDVGPVNHRVDVLTILAFFTAYLGVDPRAGLDTLDWLALPEQRLLTVTAGQVYHDGLGQLEPLRAKLAYYPHEVWLYLLACQWRRIEQEEAFVGRCGDVGDEFGSRVVAARLVRDVMKLCFLLERRYAPYSKWFGTAFARLHCAPQLTPILQRVFDAADWHTREATLGEAYILVAGMHNALALTPPLETAVSPFYGRPYNVIHGDRFAEALRAAITDETLRALPLVGSVDQWVDSTDVLSYPARYRQLKTLSTTRGTTSIS